jgi:hypothetical protein
MMKCYENPLVAAKIWRYIPPIISSAEQQMAIDSWLLEASTVVVIIPRLCVFINGRPQLFPWAIINGNIPIFGVI